MYFVSNLAALSVIVPPAVIVPNMQTSEDSVGAEVTGAEVTGEEVTGTFVTGAEVTGEEVTGVLT